MCSVALKEQLIETLKGQLASENSVLNEAHSFMNRRQGEQVVVVKTLKGGKTIEDPSFVKDRTGKG